MNKSKYIEDDLLSDARTSWPKDAKGPDPRIRDFTFKVESYDFLDDLSDSSAQTNTGDYWIKSFTHMTAAVKAYHKRCLRAKTERCDLSVKLEFGSVWMSIPEIVTPTIGNTYIYLARWRSDGAFIESYHVNETKFGERSRQKRRHFDELSRSTQHPGLMSYWVEQHKSKQRKKE